MMKSQISRQDLISTYKKLNLPKEDAINDSTPIGNIDLEPAVILLQKMYHSLKDCNNDDLKAIL